MERARTEWLRALGFEQTQLKDQHGLIIVIHSLSMQFKKPAYFNDMLADHCELSELGRSSLIMQQSISRDGLVLIEAQVKAAFVDAVSFKPIGVPDKMRHKIQLEKPQELL